MKFITKRVNVSKANDVYAVISTGPSRVLRVSEDGIAYWEDAPSRITCRSKAHLAYWMGQLDTSKGGISVLFGDI